VDFLERAAPAIFTSDQGAQCTSVAFTSWQDQRGIRISLDWRGRALATNFARRLALGLLDAGTACVADILTVQVCRKEHRSYRQRIDDSVVRIYWLMRPNTRQNELT